MRKWNETCYLSNLPIIKGEKVYLLLIVVQEKTLADEQYNVDSLGDLFLPPIEGTYDGSGNICNIEYNNILLKYIQYFNYVVKNDNVFVPQTLEEFVANIDDISVGNNGKICFSKIWILKDLYDTLQKSVAHRIVTKTKEPLALFYKKVIEHKILAIKTNKKRINYLENKIDKNLNCFSTLYNLDIMLDYKDSLYPILTPTFIDYIGMRDDSEKYIDEILNILLLFYIFNKLRKGFFCNIGLGYTCEETHLHIEIAQWILKNVPDIID